MAVSTYTMDALDNFTREELPSVIRESLPKLDPVQRMLQTFSMGVNRSSIGRDWEVEHLFGTGVAGLINNADPRGPAMYNSDEHMQSLVLDSTSAAMAPFPNPASVPFTSSLLRVLKLHRCVGNFSVPITWLQGEALGANQIRQIQRNVKKVGENLALQEAISFFMPSNNCLCQIDNLTEDAGTTTAAASSTFTVKAGTGRTQYFRVGQMVDIIDDVSGTPQFGTAVDGTDRLNYVTTYGYTPLIVSDVDYLSGVITISSVNDTDISSNGNYVATIADDDWVILRDNHTASREMRTYGIEDWTASSGQILGGSGTLGNRLNPALDLDTYSQFKSLVSAINAPLTETVLNAKVGGFIQAYPGMNLDTIITTMGVQMKYLEQPSVYGNATMFWDRDGKALDYQGGWDTVGYSFAGRRYNWIVSSMCIGQRLYVEKFGEGNIKRYIPPRIGGSDATIGSEVEFVVPLATKGGSIFKLAHNSSGQTMDLLEAPFTEYVLVAPEDVRGIKLTALTESSLG